MVFCVLLKVRIGFISAMVSPELRSALILV